MMRAGTPFMAIITGPEPYTRRHKASRGCLSQDAVLRGLNADAAAVVCGACGQPPRVDGGNIPTPTGSGPEHATLVAFKVQHGVASLCREDRPQPTGAVAPKTLATPLTKKEVWAAEGPDRAARPGAGRLGKAGGRVGPLVVGGPYRRGCGVKKEAKDRVF
jgi:hypothetical protein